MFRKFINITIYLLVVLLPKTSIANNNALYNFAGILPIITDNQNQAWVYFGVEYVNNEKKLALLAGQKDNKDESSITTAVRELNEESLDVFSEYIKDNKLSDSHIDYDILFLLSTKLYLLDIKYNTNNKSCDPFISLYNNRRYNGAGKYKRLKLAQRETYELRKVKVSDLVNFLNEPKKYKNKLTSYGGKNCTVQDDIELRWSSQIILKGQSYFNKYL